MNTFKLDCADDELRDAVVAWSELLSKERFDEALAMFLHTSESFGFEWTPIHLEDWISNYGCARSDYDCEEYHKISSLFEQPLSEQFIRKAIKIDRENLYGLNPKQYVGMVHYDDIPLNGEPSDLTARFHIKKIGDGTLTLEFLGVHVM